jgi:hypothetical protein
MSSSTVPSTTQVNTDIDIDIDRRATSTDTKKQEEEKTTLAPSTPIRSVTAPALSVAPGAPLRVRRNSKPDVTLKRKLDFGTDDILQSLEERRAKLRSRFNDEQRLKYDTLFKSITGDIRDLEQLIGTATFDEYEVKDEEEEEAPKFEDTDPMHCHEILPQSLFSPIRNPPAAEEEEALELAV